MVCPGIGLTRYLIHLEQLKRNCLAWLVSTRFAGELLDAGSVSVIWADC